MSEIGKILKEMHESVSMSQKQVKSSFKTGKGEYAEKDRFIGVRVPHIRKIAKGYKDLPFEELSELIKSKINEIRAFALIILVDRYKRRKTTDSEKKSIYDFYLKHMKYVNNWNLVDISAHHIVGSYLLDKDTGSLFDLAESDNLWFRRIAIVSSWYFIKQGELDLTYDLAIKLMQDEQDLIHKAVGWMLREAGKMDEARLIAFVKKHEPNMPRTMYRYAIERLKM